MKKLILKPGFEAIFALSIIAIIGLPPLVFGQNKKEITETRHFELNIDNGDTVINGKNLKDLKGKDREEALASINKNTNGTINIFPGAGKKQYRVEVRRRDGRPVKDSSSQDVSIRYGFFPADSYTLADSSNKRFNNITLQRSSDRTYDFNYDNGDEFLTTRPGRTMAFRINRASGEFGSRNIQNFNYESTDDEGISTHISYRVGDASKEKLKSIASAEKAELAIKDINLNPEFSTGKTNLSFNLPAKSTAEVQFKDSKGKVLWSDKTATGSFSKSFGLGLNGAYYLQVKQGSNIALKRIVKED